MRCVLLRVSVVVKVWPVLNTSACSESREFPV